MAVIRHISKLSASVVVILVGTLLLKNAIVTGSPQCSKYDFPCENGECVDSGLWCDSSKDCSDGSDEKYCKKSGLFNSDPNICPKAYFKCRDGPCIPAAGRCDGYENCNDSSDEEKCEQPDSTLKSESVTLPSQGRAINNHTTTEDMSPKSEIEGSNATRFYISLNVSQNYVRMGQFSGFFLSDFIGQRNTARKWLLSQRRADFGWDDETPRAITALYLSDEQPMAKRAEIDMLMIKQLEMQLSLELARNETKPMKLTDLALYLSALYISCKNPQNFYGDDLVSILRDGVDAAQRKDEFINPSIYLTLCINSAATYDDTRKLHDILLSRNSTISRIDMQALALLASACIFRKTNFLNASMYDNLKMEFLRDVKVHGFPGNVHEAALLFQALKELKVTLTGLTDFILKHQQTDGSFGDLLSTYIVLPILAGRNMVQMIDHCGQRNTSDLIPLEVLKNVKRRKMHVHYSLNYGFPPEVTQTLQMHVTEGTNFLNTMRLAQEINPKYRFKLSENREVPVVYSVGGMPNDVEKGMYWTLYKASRNSSESTNEILWIPYIGDISQLTLAEGDRVLYWYRPV